jgi:hypothetical protein
LQALLGARLALEPSCDSPGEPRWKQSHEELYNEQHSLTRDVCSGDCSWAHHSRFARLAPTTCTDAPCLPCVDAWGAGDGVAYNDHQKHTAVVLQSGQ